MESTIDKANATQIFDNPFRDMSLRLLIQKYKTSALGFPLNSETGQPDDGGPLISTAFDEVHLLGRGDLTIALLGTQISGPDDGSKTQVTLNVFHPRPELIKLSEDRIKLRKQFDEGAMLLLHSDHPNIARFLGLYEIRLGSAKPFSAVARKYFPTVLSEMMRKDKVFSTNEMASLILQVADATEYLYKEHQRVLMDITPGNIGVEDGTYGLTDINLSAPEGVVLRQGDILDLSFDALPPEMAPTEYEVTASPRLAVYQLGLLAYELCGGKRPTQDDLVFGTSYLPELPSLTSQLTHVLQKATANNPTERYDTITEFKNALVSAIG